MIRRATMLVCLLVVAGCGRKEAGSTRRQVSLQGQALLKPVLDALEEHHGRHGIYPASLDSLIDAELLREIPILPEVPESVGVRQATYEVSADGTFFTLSFSYDMPGTFGPGAYIISIYSSSDRSWLTGKYPPGFSDLYGEWVGKQYRQDGSQKHLDLAVRHLIEAAKAGGYSLYPERVMKVLGPGLKVAVPPELAHPDDTEALLYASKENADSGYLFISHIRNLKVIDEKKPFALVRAVYLRTAGADGKTTWKPVSPP